MQSLATALSSKPQGEARWQDFDVRASAYMPNVLTTLALNHVYALLKLPGLLSKAAEAEDPEAAKAAALDGFFSTGLWTRTAFKWSHAELMTAHVQHALEGCLFPTASPPASPLATLLLQNTSQSARSLDKQYSGQSGAVVARLRNAAHLVALGGLGAVLPCTAALLVDLAQNVVVVGNALLTRRDEIELEAALVRFNAECEAQHASAAAATGAGDTPPTPPKLVDVEAYMTCHTAFHPTNRSMVRRARRLAEERAGLRKGEALIGGPGVKAPRVGTEGLTVYQFVNAVDAVDVEVVKAALWTYIALPAVAGLLVQLRSVAFTASGAGLGTLVSPGTGTAIGKVAASVVKMLF